MNRGLSYASVLPSLYKYKIIYRHVVFREKYFQCVHCNESRIVKMFNAQSTAQSVHCNVVIARVDS